MTITQKKLFFPNMEEREFAVLYTRGTDLEKMISPGKDHYISSECSQLLKIVVEGLRSYYYDGNADKFYITKWCESFLNYVYSIDDISPEMKENLILYGRDMLNVKYRVKCIGT